MATPTPQGFKKIPSLEKGGKPGIYPPGPGIYDLDVYFGAPLSRIDAPWYIPGFGPFWMAKKLAAKPGVGGEKSPAKAKEGKRASHMQLIFGAPRGAGSGHVSRKTFGGGDETSCSQQIS